MTTQQIPQLDAQLRERVGSRYAARLREAGQLPAVLYGHGQAPVSLALDYRAFTDLLHGNAHLIELSLDGGNQAVLVREVQWDHLGIKIVHVDLARVDLTEEVEVEVELELVGEPKALQEAGTVLDHPISVIEVRCRANEIPEVIRYDVSELAVGETVTVADLQLPPGVTAVTDAETVLAHIQVMAEAPEEEEAAAATAEPELIRKPGAEEEPAEA